MQKLGELFQAWWGERVQLVMSVRAEVNDLERDFKRWREERGHDHLAYVPLTRFLDWLRVQKLQTYQYRGMYIVEGCRLIPEPLDPSLAAVVAGEGHARELAAAEPAEEVDHDHLRWGDDGGR